MFWQRSLSALLAGAFVAAAALPARADDCAPATRTICCTEWVPEKVQCTRTVLKTECKEEKYTAFRCECVPETKVCTRTVMKPVMETQTVMKSCWETVKCVEQKTTWKKCVTYQNVTTMCRKCVDKGHYECREVPCGPSFGDFLKKCCGKNDCCDTCPKTKTVKVWVPCKVWVECPVTKCKKCVTCVPVTCNVTVCKKVCKQVPCQVNVCKYVATEEKATYTCMAVKKIPYEATRMVRTCVPVQETYTATRYVAKKVEKVVPVTPCCQPTCCEKPSCGGKLFRKSCCD
jgi:hypothetical protein